jgi:bacteriorhodopsin
MPKNPFKTKQETKKEKDVKIEFFAKLTTLIATAFGLVAALAWNDAIQSFFKMLPIQNQQVGAKFIYAIFITIIVVLIIYYFNQASEFAIHEIELSKQRAAERTRERAKTTRKKK